MKDKTKQTIKDIGEVVGAILMMLLSLLLFWLYLMATPDQFSAECEYLRAEMEGKHNHFTIQIKETPNVSSDNK